MGNQTSASKQKDLYKQVNNSNPILMDNMKSSRPCKIKEGKIIQNFNNFQEEYDSLNKHLEKLKNKMNIVISNDAIELIQKRLEELNKLAINNDIQNAISSFYLTYKNNLQNYYTYIGDIKKVFKDTYLAISNLLMPWLKDQKDIDLDKELLNVEDLARNMNEAVNNFSKFEEVKELVNKICYFELDYKSKDKYTLMDQYYKDNKEEIEKNYKFENLPQFRSVINLRDLLMENIEQKNSFAGTIEDFHKEYLGLYKMILKKMNGSDIERQDMVNEFNEYNSVIIYHRLIRSTEEKLKLIKFE